MNPRRTALAAATLAAPLAGAALLVAPISTPVYALADCGWAGPPWYPPAGGLGQSPRPSCITASDRFDFDGALPLSVSVRPSPPCGPGH